MEDDNNVEQGQSPSARATNNRGQNAAVAPEKPAASTLSAGASLATSGTTIASSVVRPQTTPAAPEPQAPAAALDELATATRTTPATATSPAQLVAPIHTLLVTDWKRRKVPVNMAGGVTPVDIPPLVAA